MTLFTHGFCTHNKLRIFITFCVLLNLCTPVVFPTIRNEWVRLQEVYSTFPHPNIQMSLSRHAHTPYAPLSGFHGNPHRNIVFPLVVFPVQTHLLFRIGMQCGKALQLIAIISH